MNTKTLSDRALAVIDQYMHFQFGGTVCSIPYFNNKVSRQRAGMRVRIGKGSPHEILEELKTITIKRHVAISSLSDEMLKKLLVDENIGIDCSGFAYYVLNAESAERGRGTIDKHIHFVNCRSLLGKVRCHLRPVENCDVATLADDKNSQIVGLNDVRPGDTITMIDSGVNRRSNLRLTPDRDHILIIHQVDYQNFSPTKLYYSHAVAYPEDGVYGSGVRQGAIEIVDPNKSIVEQRWVEDGKTDEDNHIFLQAKNSNTELRRLKVL